MEMKEERPLIRYEKLSKEDLVDYCNVYWRRIHTDEVLFNEIYKDIEKLKKENKNLKKKVRFLEECLDRKEKLNEEYRKEIEELKYTYVYDAKQVRDIC